MTILFEFLKISLSKSSITLTRSINRFYGPFNSNAFTVKVTWNLPEDVTARQVEAIWAYYLQGFLYGGDSEGRNLYSSPYAYTCTLIPHYREFSVTSFKSHLWVCARRPMDGSTRQQRAETLAYVTSRLKENSQLHSSGFYCARDGEPVIVVFGLDITLYYWRKREDEDEDEGSLEPHMHFDDFSKEEVRLEMETKFLIPLLKGWEEKMERDTAEALESRGSGS
jgi:hypothetical protein